MTRSTTAEKDDQLYRRHRNSK